MKILKIIGQILMGLMLIALVSVIVFILIKCYEWQKGYTPTEWLVAGIEELEKENKLPDYDEYDIKAIKPIREQEENYICCSYEVVFFEYIETDSVNDIDLCCAKTTIYTFNIWLERSNYFWNRWFYSYGKSEGKYERCVDYVIKNANEKDKAILTKWLKENIDKESLKKWLEEE